MNRCSKRPTCDCYPCAARRAARVSPGACCEPTCYTLGRITETPNARATQYVDFDVGMTVLVLSVAVDPFDGKVWARVYVRGAAIAWVSATLLVTR